MALEARVTLLVENTVRGRDMCGEHGLAYWIEWGDRRFLFDTGQGLALARNAGQLRVDLASAEAVVFSHGHYDHTSGLAAVLDTGARPRIVAHRAAFEPKFVQRADGQIQEIGMPAALLARVRALGLEVVHPERITELAEGLYVTGEIARHTDFEESSAAFLKDEHGTLDPLVDDQAVFFDTEDGLVVLLGCAHSGVINTLRHVEAYLSGRRVDTVIGGMHLAGASASRLERTIAALQEIAPRRLGGAHCTGIRAVSRLWSQLPDSAVEAIVGSRWSFKVRS
jgi:7,8-dihydropterin-6-yl-methyl-4-(beta-D-ribofuranosyl)aminobenzene 5'-phosphate synthase